MRFNISESSVTMAHMRSGLQFTGYAGEYYVCAEICRRGFLALTTPKSHPTFDILATNEEGTASVGIQVKTRFDTKGWILGKKIETPREEENLFLILVDLSEFGASPRFYIFRYKEFSTRIVRDHQRYMQGTRRDGTPRGQTAFQCFWANRLTDEDKASEGRWDLILEHLKKRE